MSYRSPRPETHSEQFKDPFADRIKPKLLFNYPAFAEAFDALYFHVLKRRGLALLVGEPGMGKTALLECLRDQAFISDRGWSVRGDRVVCPDPDPCIVNDRSGLPIAKLVTLLRVGNGYADPHRRREEWPDGEEQLQGLADKLLACAQRKVTVAVLIDDAQTLSEAAFANLCSLTAPRDRKSPLLQVILAGTPDLQERLELAETDPAMPTLATRVRLTGLERRDVGPYIEHRMRVGGRLDGVLFTPEAVERIAAHSDGVPLKINQIASAALRTACTRSNTSVPADVVDQVSEKCAQQWATLAGRLGNRPPRAAVVLIDRPRIGRSASAAGSPPDGYRPVMARRQGGWRGRIAALTALGASTAITGITVAAFWGLGAWGVDSALRPRAAGPTERLMARLDRPMAETGRVPVPASGPAAVASDPTDTARPPKPWGEDLPGLHNGPSVPLPKPRPAPVAVTAAQPEPTGSTSEPPAAMPEPPAEDIPPPAKVVAPTLAPPTGSTEDEAPELEPAAKPDAPPNMTMTTPTAETEATPPDLTMASDPSSTTIPAPPEIVSPPQTREPRTPEPQPAPAPPAVASAAARDAPPTSGQRPAADPVASSGVKVNSISAAPGRAAPAMDAPALQRMITRGEALLSAGDVVSARLLYELAASRGSPAAATKAGKTYDPFFLAEANIHSAQADPAKAAEWYRKAVQGGDVDALGRLQRLNGRLGQ